ncbi:MAG: MBL fold metallo-hydrolase [Desulfobulbaceae bacterium]|nr:MBL fold metallo-hydrolase [Desulfobulbaceae bacterium]HIJ89504.1 MBL fold metallo-hydrolase [Deltaproteobacteria bacterium]
MKVVQLARNLDIYTCNSYLLLGDWNRLEDLNTLIDPGADGSVIRQIERLSTGCGKRGVEQVILTHEHFDHADGAAEVKKKYDCPIFAFKPGKGVDEVLQNGQKLLAADRTLEVIHAPIHSNDSICLYCAEEGLLFSGDTPLKIMRGGGSYSQAFSDLLARFSQLRIEAVYSGHDEPLTTEAAQVVRRSHMHVLTSTCT